MSNANVYTQAVEDNPQLVQDLDVHLSKYIPITLTPKQQAFLWLPHSEALYGGAAGGGKSVALLAAALQYVDVPGYSALLLRRTFTDLRLPRALMDLAQEWLAGTDAKWSERDKRWDFPSKASLSFGFLEVENDKYRYQSAAFQFIGFDELTQFTESQYTYMFSRRRRMKGHDVPVRVRAATNPGGVGHDWVRRRFITPEARERGRVFISAKMQDNPYLDSDDYAQALGELDPVNRKRLRDGNWDISLVGNMFKEEDFHIVKPHEVPRTVVYVRYWDLAASKDKGDYTAGCKMGIEPYTRNIYIAPVFRKQQSPAENEKTVRDTAIADGLGVPIFMEQEPGSAGVNNIDNYARNIIPEFNFKGIPSSGNKITRAAAFSSAADNGRVHLIEGGWIKEYLEELVAFPTEGVHDDQVDASSGAFNQLSEVQVELLTMALAEQLDLS